MFDMFEHYRWLSGLGKDGVVAAQYSVSSAVGYIGPLTITSSTSCVHRKTSFFILTSARLRSALSQ